MRLPKRLPSFLGVGERERDLGDALALALGELLGEPLRGELLGEGERERFGEADRLGDALFLGDADLGEDAALCTGEVRSRTGDAVCFFSSLVRNLRFLTGGSAEADDGSPGSSALDC